MRDSHGATAVFSHVFAGLFESLPFLRPPGRRVSRPLAHRFAFVSATLSVLLVIVVGAELHRMASDSLLAQHRGNVRANATLVARQTEELLTAVVRTMEDLADNDAIAAAIARGTVRKTDLVPFLRSFDRVAGVPVSLVYTDATITAIADNRMGGVTARDMAWLAAAAGSGRPVATVVEDDGRPFLLGAEMLVHSATLSQQGALLYKLPLNALVLHPQAHLRHAGSAPAEPAAGWFGTDIPLQLPDRLAALGLTIRLDAPKAPEPAQAGIGLSAYALVGLAALVLIVVGCRTAGNHLTRSLRDLEQLAGAVLRDGCSGQRATVRSDDEVGRLARAFNMMLDQIDRIQRDRNRLAEDEIAVQRALVRDAEQARAEAEAARAEAQRACQAAVKALDTAQRASQAKTDFLAAASHDLRQPVQSLVLLTGSLRARLADHPAEALVGKLETSVQALCRMLEALLDISKLDASAVPVDLRPVPLHHVLDDLEDEYRLRAAEQGLELRVVPSSLTVRTDPALLERVLRNLLENALRYTDRGRILVGCRRRGDRLLIQVHDTGIGIPPEHLERIFLEFYQIANPARDRGKGLGLGLAIVHRLAVLLECRVQVASVPGRGSCFTIAIPLDMDSGRSAPGAEDGGGGDQDGRQPARPVALAVDDDPLVREGLSLLLAQLGWTVLAAATAADAFDRLASAPDQPALVIADHRLDGGVTGLEVLRAVEARLSRPALSVILTGDTAPDLIAAIAAGGYRVLHKPLAVRDLKALLDEALGVPA
ncbi:hybrid sensor histidine kinase/response regulator [Azospirillum rugosum]|uniref:histidine kinase n=1 Tax=Azospirillum rugosum TaxID=416170 RepID=A0ABS4SSA6_9PROT|nr:hybrid sensor histidine kinase/response regulator [Azospirillum rugosum]MBP2295446.1 signal transduction histidine kinase/CheY-like chemotaxis protein [Azospirillum rugosum]MDQ0528325.1 signal transduction histidine kinase/CheY-like chemotaxis protein [Azospirillum rugosum]